MRLGHAGLTMKKPAAKVIFYTALMLLFLSVTLALASFYSAPDSQAQVASSQVQNSNIIDSSFTLTPRETYRQGLGSFHGGENISMLISASSRINFSLVTYGGLRYSNATEDTLSYSFTAGADYYEAVFLGYSSAADVHFVVSVEKQQVTYPFDWLDGTAKAMFFASLAVAVVALLFALANGNGRQSSSQSAKPDAPMLSKRRLRQLQVALLVSLVFWLVVVAVNSYPLATFENWYTDSARHPYSASLFPQVGFRVFSTPLGELSSSDASAYKFVTWAEMPHLYPLGSIFLFLPFGMLLQTGTAESLVFKAEIALFIVVAHLCMYYFMKRFMRQDVHVGLKALAVYILYVSLVVYAADGMFDSVAFLFSLLAVGMFLGERYDLFLLLTAVSMTFKYQAGIFLFPLIAISLIILFRQSNRWSLLKNKALLAAAGLAVLDLFTAYLSAPFLMAARPELVMNSVNAFSPHAQIPWWLQVFAVFLLMAVTLICAFYMFRRNRLVSLFMVFSLLPCLTMPYFQTWYLPFFYVIALIPKQKRDLEVTVIWLVIISLVLSYGGFSFNPLQIADSLRKVLGF